jgi:hypothetical protein
MPVKLAGFSGLEFDVPRDAEVLLELVEAAYAEQGVHDDQQRPALADQLDARAIEQF